MRDLPARDVWKAVLGELQLQLPRPSFDTWLQPTEGVRYDEHTFVVQVPTPFTVAWLERRMYQTIHQTLERVTQRSLDIHFQVNTVAPAPAATGPQPLHIGQGRGAEVSQGLPPEGDPQVGASRRAYPVPSFNPNYTFQSFVVGPSNRLAHSAAQAVADAPGQGFNPLFLYAGVGLGKTHILHAIGQACASRDQNVLYVSSEQFTNEFISAIRSQNTAEFRSRYRNVQVLLIDDVQFMSGKEQTQESFFHTFNDLHNSGRQIVLTSDRPPKSLALLEDRLRSRFEWGLIADIQPPDLETRIAILSYKADQLRFSIPETVLELIAKRVQKNIRELEGTLNRVMARSQLMHLSITLDSTSRILDDLVSDAERHAIKPEGIIDQVSRYYRVSCEELIGPRRTKRLAKARQVAMYLLIYELSMSPTEVGRLLGGRDHSTIMYGAGKINGDINEDGQLRQDVLAIKEAIFT